MFNAGELQTKNSHENALTSSQSATIRRVLSRLCYQQTIANCSVNHRYFNRVQINLQRNHRLTNHKIMYVDYFAFSALTLSAGWQARHPVTCTNL